MKKKWILTLTALSLFLTGCQSSEKQRKLKEPKYIEGNIGQLDVDGDMELEDREKYLLENHEDIQNDSKDLQRHALAGNDNALINPLVVGNDPLLAQGDYGIENEIENYIPQTPLSAKEERLGLSRVHHTRANPQLHAVFVNPNVKPKYGSYIEDIITFGWRYFGTPYEYGSNRNTPTTFDCSDYVRWIHLIATGMDLPKDSRSQWQYVKKFSKRSFTDLRQAKRGDLLFFMSYKGWRKDDYNGVNVKSQPVAHCGIYLGNGKMLHTASQKTNGVRVDSVFGNHLEYRFIGGGQVIQ